MNRLPRAITAQLFSDESCYSALQKHWSFLINGSRPAELSAAHHLLYLSLLGKDWRKSFTPITNPKKLANGASWNWGLRYALHTLHQPALEESLLAPFDGFVSREMLQQIRAILPKITHLLNAEEFTRERFPMDAYSIETVTAFECKEGADHA